MTIQLEFTPEIRSILNHERYHHFVPLVQRRMEALWLKSHGLSHEQIAKLVGVTENTIREYFEMYKAGGIEQLKEVTFYRPKSELESYTTTLAAALSDPEEKERIKDLTLRGAPDKLNWVTMFGWDSFKIIKAPRNKSLIGQTLSDVAREENREPFDVAVELFLQEKNDLVISVFTMSDPDIASALQKDWMMIGSDAGALTMKAGPDVHPGSYGTFPRLFRKYVREEGILTVEETVRKLSFLPARFLGLDDRGSLVKGAKADIVIFDPKGIQEEENGFDASHRRPGIDYVMINGRISLEKGVFNNSLNGRVLRHGR